MECRNVLSARFQRFCSLLDTLKTLEFGTFLILTDNDKETLNIYKPTDEGGGRFVALKGPKK
jgi:hypothetical protein